MEDIKFNCYQDIKDFIGLCEEERKETQERIVEMEKSLDLGFIESIKRSKELKEIRKKLVQDQKKRKELDKKISFCNKKLESYSNFDIKKFTKFLIDYLSLMENEEYVLIKRFEEEEHYFGGSGLQPDVNHYHDVITTRSNANKFRRRRSSVSEPFENYVEDCDNKNYICFMSGFGCCSFNELNSGYIHNNSFQFPYLADLERQCVDLRLANPNMSDDDILETMLSNCKKEVDSRKNSSK